MDRINDLPDDQVQPIDIYANSGFVVMRQHDNGNDVEHVICIPLANAQREAARIINSTGPAGAISASTLKLRQHYPEHGGFYIGLLFEGEQAYANFSPALTDYAPIIGEWGKPGIQIAGASSLSDGLANTDAMAAAGSETAIQTRALTIAGLDGWHIASKQQAALAHLYAPQSLPESWIHTSTQHSANLAWCQHPNGTQGWSSKTSEGAVLPVRRLPVIQ